MKKCSKNLLIERERHPSWVSFTLSSFPEMHPFRDFLSVYDLAVTGEVILIIHKL